MRRAARAGRRNEQPTGAASDARVYVVRGEVISVPQADKPGTEFIVKHEPIDNFRNASGQIVGMSTMGMPFTPGKGVLLDGIKPGDKIEMRWVSAVETRSEGICGVGAEAADGDATEVWRCASAEDIARNDARRALDARHLKSDWNSCPTVVRPKQDFALHVCLVEKQPD